MEDGVVVNLQWRTQNGVTYDITSLPSVPTRWKGQMPMGFSEIVSVQLQISYNTKYYVTIEATLCGHNTVNTNISLNHGK